MLGVRVCWLLDKNDCSMLETLTHNGKCGVMLSWHRIPISVKLSYLKRLEDVRCFSAILIRDRKATPTRDQVLRVGVLWRSPLVMVSREQVIASHNGYATQASVSHNKRMLLMLLVEQSCLSFIDGCLGHLPLLFQAMVHQNHGDCPFLAMSAQ